MPVFKVSPPHFWNERLRIALFGCSDPPMIAHAPHLSPLISHHLLLSECSSIPPINMIIGDHARVTNPKTGCRWPRGRHKNLRNQRHGANSSPTRSNATKAPLRGTKKPLTHGTNCTLYTITQLAANATCTRTGLIEDLQQLRAAAAATLSPTLRCIHMSVSATSGLSAANGAIWK